MEAEETGVDVKIEVVKDEKIEIDDGCLEDADHFDLVSEEISHEVNSNVGREASVEVKEEDEPEVIEKDDERPRPKKKRKQRKRARYNFENKAKMMKKYSQERRLRRLETETEEQREDRMERARLAQRMNYAKVPSKLRKEKWALLRAVKKSQRGENLSKYEKELVEKDKKTKEEEEERRKAQWETNIREHAEKEKEKKRQLKFKQFSKRLNMTKEERKAARKKDRLWRQRQEASKTPEELREERRIKVEKARIWRQNLTPEKRKRYLDSLKRSQQKKLEELKKNPERYKEFQEKLKKTLETEGPEARQRRLLSYRIVAAKQKLKKKMLAEGTAPEEIEVCLQALAAEMRAEPMPSPDKVSTYKPRPRKQKDKVMPDNNRVKKVGPPVATVASSAALGSASIQVMQAPAIRFQNTTDVIQICSDNRNYSPEDADEPKFSGAADYEDFFEPPPASPPPPPANCNLIAENPKSCEMETLTTSDTITPINVSVESINRPHHNIGLIRSQKLGPTQFQVSKIIRQKIWKCPKCSEAMSNPTEFAEHFKLHMKKSSSEPIAKEPEPAAPNSSSSGVDSVTKKLKMEKKFRCLKCPLIPRKGKKGSGTFGTLTGLSLHVKRLHRSSHWPCPHCNILKYRKTSLQTHMEICSRARRNQGLLTMSDT